MPTKISQCLLVLTPLIRKTTQVKLSKFHLVAQLIVLIL